MTTLPEGSWDCHAHIIGDPSRYPLAPTRAYDPRPAPLEAYLDLLDRNGLARGVLVQPSVFGFDNRCMLDAMTRAEGRLVGVAVPAPDTPAREFETLHRNGVRAVRVNVIDPGGITPDTAIGWLPILKDLGWHVQIQLDIGAIPDPEALIARFDVPVVVDHMGRPRPGKASPEGSRVARLIELVRAHDCYVKLSAPYRWSKGRAPWADVSPLARALMTANPHACLWATDWPHTQTDSSIPEDGLINALHGWCPEPALLRTILVENPRLLYATP